MQKDELLALAERVEALQGRNMEVDAEIARTTGWVHKCSDVWGIGAPHWWKEDKCFHDFAGPHWYGQGAILPPFTASLDAAMTLVPEGWNWMTGERDRKGRPRAYVNNGKRLTIRSGLRNGLRSNPEAIWCEVVAATPTLALCAAALRALAGGE